jgi:hypothetical protein
VSFFEVFFNKGIYKLYNANVSPTLTLTITPTKMKESLYFNQTELHLTFDILELLFQYHILFGINERRMHMWWIVKWLNDVYSFFKWCLYLIWPFFYKRKLNNKSPYFDLFKFFKSYCDSILTNCFRVFCFHISVFSSFTIRNGYFSCWLKEFHVLNRKKGLSIKSFQVISLWTSAKSLRNNTRHYNT